MMNFSISTGKTILIVTFAVHECCWAEASYHHNLQCSYRFMREVWRHGDCCRVVILSTPARSLATWTWLSSGYPMAFENMSVFRSSIGLRSLMCIDKYRQEIKHAHHFYIYSHTYQTYKTPPYVNCSCIAPNRSCIVGVAHEYYMQIRLTLC